MFNYFYNRKYNNYIIQIYVLVQKYIRLIFKYVILFRLLYFISILVNIGLYLTL